MIRSVKELRNKHKYEDVWILGSGSSLNFIAPEFFTNKLVIGVNWMYRHFTCDYLVVHHHEIVKQICLERALDQLFFKLVVSEFQCCAFKDGQYAFPDAEIYIYKHEDQGYMVNNYRPLIIPTADKILSGGTTVIDAVGLAIHMGCRNIMLCGCDGGGIDNETNIRNYYREYSKSDQIGHSVRSLQIIIELRDELKKYGINIYTLSPFMGLGLEEHKLRMDY